jgi:hypothetical protein
MKTYRIHFWHGRDQKLINKLKSIDGVVDESDESNSLNIFYTGTLDNFIESYGSKIIVIPGDNNVIPIIAVTQFNCFGQR